MLRWSKGWEDGGRRFSLELCANGVGRFLFCSVVAKEAKRFSLIFPEGKGFLKGWTVLAEKLHLLGVAPKAESRKGASSAEELQESLVVIEKGSFLDPRKIWAW